MFTGGLIPIGSGKRSAHAFRYLGRRRHLTSAGSNTLPEQSVVRMVDHFSEFLI